MASLLPAPFTCSIGQKQSLLQRRRSQFTQSSIMVQSVHDPENSLEKYMHLQHEFLNSDGPERKCPTYTPSYTTSAADFIAGIGAPEPKWPKDYAKMIGLEQSAHMEMDGSRKSLGGC
mmetsp:Transcript_70769/g.229927  ORF Transcript_70769/g.229927 Transcript_70769/m.229927 type:complete len:118 (-) Transcript_70769:128-481(-)|eukprot:CAMPEP_0203962362 /NCGR_PEP_ID=MMETSP0359-20131031/92576_1 /ASSEMBLY_ACC=CAM_ASM_000338 /TAXON_ID=268821 /ORGANISM="Scrippsiella Hangoei, Strain SHTV-5" /LENGTH=117 /DNA_ID=CAMNT_0050897651 /DNA_START=77 /DNA_END=430 /DNA_ORIENTATION=+